MWKVAGRAPSLQVFYPGICLTTEGKARKNHSQGKRNFSQVTKNLSQSTVYIIPINMTRFRLHPLFEMSALAWTCKKEKLHHLWMYTYVVIITTIWHYTPSWVFAFSAKSFLVLLSLTVSFQFWHVYVLGAVYFVWPWKSRVPWYRDVTTLTATDTYALRMHMCGRG
jgi:hypothetical protein